MAALNVPSLGPQPDFTSISNSIRTGADSCAESIRTSALTLAAQVERCANIPAVVQGEQLVVLLQGMDQRLQVMDQRLQRMDQRLHGIDQRLHGMDQRQERMEGRLVILEGKIDHQ